jgi:hypothetical protein
VAHGATGDKREKCKADKEKCSFLKKRTKKLLIIWPRVARKRVPNSQKFFASFFQKKDLPYLTL